MKVLSSASDAKDAVTKKYVDDLTGRLIRDLTLSSAAASVSVSADENSDSFSLREAEFNIYIPVLSSLANNAYVTLIFGINSLSSYIVNVTGTHYALSVAAAGLVRNLKTEAKTRVKVFGGSFLAVSDCLCQGYAADGTTIVSSLSLINSSPAYGVSAVGSITAFTFGLSSGNLPAGTKIRLWGWDA